MILDDLPLPIVLAPMAGGPTTPGLVAAVCESDALGFLAAGYLTPERLDEQLCALRSRTSEPFGVNLFVPPAAPADPASYAGYADRIRLWAGEHDLPAGEPRFDDDGFTDKVELLLRDPAAVVSFTFGIPAAAAIERLRQAGSEIWMTVTSPGEADLAVWAGADVLVVQGVEAGGHRGSFEDADGAEAHSLLPLLQLLAGAGRPLVATGGIVTGAGVAAALAAGARAAQLGKAFLLCPEAGTSDPHRSALKRAGAPTRLTRAFTGRTARGIVNEFMTDNDAAAVSAYPELHHLTQPLRQAARARGDASAINLWAGEGYPLIRELPAADLIAVLAREAMVSGAG